MTKNLMTRKHSHEDLETLYTDSESCDQEAFAEMRSNLLLISGEHYQKKNASFFKRIRDTKELNEQQKLRLTKNHIQKIIRSYCNNIIQAAPSVGPSPKNDSELQDQKASELHAAVWSDAKERHGFEELRDDWCDDFVGIGEVATKIFWDPAAGTVKAYKQKMHEDGSPLFTDPQGAETKDPGLDPMTGQPTHEAAPGDPIFTGDFVFETVYGFNLLRDPGSKDLKKSPYHIIRKMVPVDTLLAQFPDKEKMIKPGADQTYTIFDASKGGYRKSDKEVLLKEYYFKPCHLYPKGYFYIATKEGILAEDELAGGIYPIKVQHFDKMQTSARGRGPVKTMRPFQAEINRGASKMAEHQITLGDDKLLIQNGTKVSAGTALPGIRSVNYTGMAPTILPGRDGSQYLASMQATIVEMYSVMNVAENDAEAPAGQLDPYAILFRSASQKKKFVRYIKRFELFLKDVCKTYLSLAKLYLPDDAVVYAVGRSEQVNIPEFRNSTDICYQIKIDAIGEDVETRMGKQLVLNHALQYVGNKLDKEDIGKIMRAMPYGNFEESFDDMTMNYDSSKNMLLALDRGEQAHPSKYDDPVYMIKRLVGRVRKADFNSLDPAIKQQYAGLLQQYEQIQVKQAQDLQMAESGFIPTSGYLVSCDFYTEKPGDPTKTQRVRLPSDAISWLMKKIETQGTHLDELRGVNPGAQQEMGQMAVQTQNAESSPDGLGQPPQMGAEMPRGAMQ